MNWPGIQAFVTLIQHTISLIGVFIIISGVIYSLFQYIFSYFRSEGESINSIRLRLGKVLILGLEFIVAADLIGTTTTPDYYAVGLLAIIVLIRTVLSFSINRELMSISKEL